MMMRWIVIDFEARLILISLCLIGPILMSYSMISLGCYSQYVFLFDYFLFLHHFYDMDVLKSKF